jgi:hypothetical protein
MRMKAGSRGLDYGGLATASTERWSNRWIRKVLILRVGISRQVTSSNVRHTRGSVR